uniref:Similarity n=1 Tax=Microcystis aeruginosa (strain PCC 7806) TaxID=267872 RepID=A8YGP7_MICA7|nr:unnamed protein product [Microcystis aeruginosa PCC 7806]
MVFRELVLLSPSWGLITVSVRPTFASARFSLTSNFSSGGRGTCFSALNSAFWGTSAPGFAEATALPIAVASSCSNCAGEIFPSAKVTISNSHFEINRALTPILAWAYSTK